MAANLTGARGAAAERMGRPRRSPVIHSVAEVEQALGRIWDEARTERQSQLGDEHHVAARSSVLNLIVVAPHREIAEKCAAIVAATSWHRPSRSLILSAADSEGRPGLDAWVEALILPTPGGTTGSETIHVTAHGQTALHLASIIQPLLVHDLPVALWWPHDPQLRSHRADRLLPLADRLIVDGSEWSGNGLDRLGQLVYVASARRQAVADFALLRQARWREALASVYDLPDLRPHLSSVRSIVVDFAVADQNHCELANVVRPVYHVAWLASRLDMTVVDPMRLEDDGRRLATLRQRDHEVAVEWRPVPVSPDLGAGATACVEIESRHGAAQLVGTVTADESTVRVTIRDRGKVRVQRVYTAPRLDEVQLLETAMEDRAGDPMAAETLAMAGKILGAEGR